MLTVSAAQKLYDLQVIVTKENEAARVQTASKFWWDNNGHIPCEHVSAAFMISTNKLTVEIQRQMSVITAVELPNTAPVVTVLYTKQEIDYYARTQKYQKFEFTLEFFFYLANPNLIQQTHDTNPFEETVGNFRNEY